MFPVSWCVWSQKHGKRGTTTSKAAGVAVIKTIAKQTKNKHKNKNTTNENDDASILEHQITQLEAQARQYMEDAAMLHNYPDALVSLGNHALVNEDVHTAMEYYQKADSGEGWFNMGHLLWAGYNGVIVVDANEVEAMHAMKKAMSHGDVDAMYFVGVHLIQDFTKREEWWEVFDLHDGSSSEKVIQAIGTAVSHTERKKQGLHLK